MENKKSWLNIKTIDIIDGISLKIPAVGEILENEKSYYNLTSSLTTSPFTYMVQLDDMGIDYTQIDDWQLFQMLFCSYSNQILAYTYKINELNEKIKNNNISTIETINYKNQIKNLEQLISDIGIDLVFDNFKMIGEKNEKLYGFEIFEESSTNELILYNEATGVKIDRLVYMDIADSIRKINLYEKCTHKPGNEHMKNYLLEKERKKQKRNSKKPYEPYLEQLVIALVNTQEFPYDYDSCMDLSIYRFNQSFKQIQHKINFNNTMFGVYSGTIDTSKMTNKDCLSWFKIR